jgi:hypothetical protein
VRSASDGGSARNVAVESIPLPMPNRGSFTSVPVSPAPGLPLDEPQAPHSWARIGVVCIAVVVLLAVGAASWVVWRGDDARTPAAMSAPSSTAVDGPPSANFSPSVCRSQAPAGLPITPQAGAVRSVNGWDLYSGYSYFTGPTGYHLAVPDGWTYQTIGTTTCFRDSTGVRYLSIDPVRNPAGDPVKACRAEAKTLVATGELPAYDLVGINKVPLETKAADWEYRYRGPDQGTMHAMTRWFSLDGKAYALGWATREFDWQINLSIYSMMKSTFYVTSPSGRRSTPSPVTQR